MKIGPWRQGSATGGRRWAFGRLWRGRFASVSVVVAPARDVAGWGFQFFVWWRNGELGSSFSMRSGEGSGLWTSGDAKELRAEYSCLLGRSSIVGVPVMGLIFSPVTGGYGSASRPAGWPEAQAVPYVC